ncbi:DUF2062 domain-containing protein [Jiella sp. LLJ827]|nr:DUF2062 domain-containing protein [Jiella sp. LLJ827]MCQ0989028.1 DUF2062 domain-containing protein [Jiella sp. LLJ827]
MLFRRRVPESFWSRLRTWLWPRRSFRRSYHYFHKRVLRLDAAPHAIAAGFAAGVVASFTPFIGFHFLIAFAIAYLIAGNMAAAALGTAVGNPLTFPFIWGATFEVGHRLLTDPTVDVEAPANLERSLSPMNLGAIWEPIVKPMFVGSIPLGLLAGVISYAVVRVAAKSFQAHRQRRIANGGATLADAPKALVGRLAGHGAPQKLGRTVARSSADKL